MKRLVLAAIAAASLVSAAYGQQAGDRAIYTGGAKGAYHGLFCPPIPGVLDKAYFQGYHCATSAGTVDNMKRVAANPRAIGFAQLDVFTREQREHPDQFGKLVVVRQLACEGLWMVTRNDALTDYGRVLGLARRIQFVLPPEESGSSASFKFLQSSDPDGLGRATHMRYAQSTTDMLNQVANSKSGDVGFFVQFADPTNATIKKIVDSGLHVIPVVSRQIMALKNGEDSVYQVQTFDLTEAGFFVKAKEVTTACTPTVIFTGSPDAFPASDKNARDDQHDLIQKVREVPDNDFLPRQSTVAAIIKSAKHVGGRALDEMMAATDLARKKVEEMGQQ